MKKITFVDEKPFELFSIQNKQNARFYRKRSQKHTVPPIETTKHSTKIHAFCAINWNGKSTVRLYIDEIPKKKRERKRKK